ncbi:hypothetical protein ACOSQ3_018003 [Xanthoceras sorbifolium]
MTVIDMRILSSIPIGNRANSILSKLSLKLSHSIQSYIFGLRRDRRFVGVVGDTSIKSFVISERLNDLMESKGGKKSSSSKSLFYEAPLGYSIEDVRPNGGIKKFRSAAYSNCARKPS